MSCGRSVRQPAKLWLSLIFALLLLTTVISIRPLEKGSELFAEKVLPMSDALSNSEEEGQRIDVEEECEKNEDAEECLNRRSLAAHTDYIYTQNHNNP